MFTHHFNAYLKSYSVNLKIKTRRKRRIRFISESVVTWCGYSPLSALNTACQGSSSIQWLVRMTVLIQISIKKPNGSCEDTGITSCLPLHLPKTLAAEDRTDLYTCAVQLCCPCNKEC